LVVTVPMDASRVSAARGGHMGTFSSNPATLCNL
jgi:hypothetical protein